jgi:hypothetical protein
MVTLYWALTAMPRLSNQIRLIGQPVPSVGSRPVGVVWRKIALSLTAATVAFFSLTAVAGAMGEPETGAFNEFKVKGSNGYSILVWGLSEAGYRHGEVLLFVTRGKQSATYRASARVTDTRIDADLGHLGQVHVTFQPKGKAAFTHPACEPDSRQSYEPGSYAGTIEFHGEEGYAEASAKRAAFTYHPVLDILDCPHTVAGSLFDRGLPGAELDAIAHEDGGLVEVRVNQNRSGARVKVTAAIVERRGKIRISREVESVHKADAFHFAPDLSSASFAPLVPFSGSGVYRANAISANRWTGDLRVDFPGHSNVSLTGAKFRTHLRHAKLTKETFYPERSRRLNLPPLP